MMKMIPPEWQNEYLEARKLIDKKADHIWCITAVLSAVRSDRDELVQIDPQAMKYWMQSISLSVGRWLRYWIGWGLIRGH